jgi:DNA-binding response OmpR family regulator
VNLVAVPNFSDAYVELSSETGPSFLAGFFIMVDLTNVVTQIHGIDLDDALQRNRRVLIIDDDSDTIELLKRILILAKLDVASAKGGLEAVEIMDRVRPDVILLDLMMPDLDGRETLKRIRSKTFAPVIVVSALTNKETIVELLNLGSDDYITKPFHREEIIARINAVIRRSRMKPVFDGISIPEINLTINISKREVVFQGVRIQLSPKEFSLLEFLARNIPNAMTYEQISNEIWGCYEPGMKNRIKYLVHFIRKKIHAINAEIDVIFSIDQLGYRIRSE